MKKINIALTMRERENSEYKEKYNAVSYQMIDFLDILNFNVFLIPINNFKTDFLNSFDCNGIIFGPGEDTKFNLKKKKGTKRDLIEYQIYRYALKYDIPILGICRGMQVLNLFYGGKNNKVRNHVTNSHKISIIDNKFTSIYIKKNIYKNSYHNYGINDYNLSKYLTPWANVDKVVEGFYDKKKKVYAIGWHPERYKIFKKDDLKFIKHIFNGKN